jgi:hypothetical protein
MISSREINIKKKKATPKDRRDQILENKWRPWSVDRLGRMLAGASVLLCTLLGIIHSPWWLAGTLAAAANLVITSITDACALHDLLVRLGAREREDLFLPGGVVRPEVLVAKIRSAGLRSPITAGSEDGAAGKEEPKQGANENRLEPAIGTSVHPATTVGSRAAGRLRSNRAAK